MFHRKKSLWLFLLPGLLGLLIFYLIPFVGGNVKWEKIIPALREIGYAGDLTIDAPSYTKDFPDALMPDAMRFALEAGRHLLSL